MPLGKRATTRFCESSQLRCVHSRGSAKGAVKKGRGGRGAKCLFERPRLFITAFPQKDSCRFVRLQRGIIGGRAGVPPRSRCRFLGASGGSPPQSFCAFNLLRFLRRATKFFGKKIFVAHRGNAGSPSGEKKRSGDVCYLPRFFLGSLEVGPYLAGRESPRRGLKTAACSFLIAFRGERGNAPAVVCCSLSVVKALPSCGRALVSKHCSAFAWKSFRFFLGDFDHCSAFEGVVLVVGVK